MKVAINRSVGRAHMKGDRIVDPIADGVVFESPVGDRRGKGKARRVESWELDIEVNGANLAAEHGR